MHCSRMQWIYLLAATFGPVGYVDGCPGGKFVLHRGICYDWASKSGTQDVHNLTCLGFNSKLIRLKYEKQWKILPAIVNRIVNKKGRRPGATFSWWTGLRALNVQNGLVAFVDMDREEEVNIPAVWLARLFRHNANCSRCGVYILAQRQQDYHVQIKLVIADVNFRLPWALCEQRRIVETTTTTTTTTTTAITTTGTMTTKKNKKKGRMQKGNGTKCNKTRKKTSCGKTKSVANKKRKKMMYFGHQFKRVPSLSDEEMEEIFAEDRGTTSTGSQLVSYLATTIGICLLT